MANYINYGMSGLNSELSKYYQDRIIIPMQAQSAGTTLQVKTEVKKEKKDMFKSIKEYYEKHNEVIITIVVVFLVDHYAFGGKFKEKIELMFESLVSKTSDKIKAA